MGIGSGAGGVRSGAVSVVSEDLLGDESVELQGQVVIRWLDFLLPPSVGGCLSEWGPSRRCL